MAEKELKVSISIDRSGAKADAQAWRQDVEKVNQALLSDARRTENARVQLARDAQGRFVAGSRQARSAAVSDFAEMGKAGQSAFEKLRASSGSMFSGMGAAFEASAAGFRKLMGLANAYGDAIKASQEKYQQYTTQFASQREALGTLANLMGRKADDAFVLEQARFNKSVGFTPEEGRRFQESYLNAGAQYKGTRISEAEFSELSQQAGTLALARGVDPGMVADLSAKGLGFKDYSKLGDEASEAALGDTNQALAILSAGSGSEAQLGQETAKLAASSLNEDELRGSFSSIKDVAKLISVLTEGFPEGQAEAGANLLRASRDFTKKKGGAFLRSAGVTPKDNPFEAIRKIGEEAEKRAKEGPEGTTVQDVLTSNFEDSLAARTLSTAYNKGTIGGLFEARDKVAAENEGPGPALAQNQAFLKSKRGLTREADADRLLAEAELGQKNADLDILRKQSVTRMMRSGELDKPSEKVQDFLANNLSFGLIGDAEKRRIDQDVWMQLQKRTPRGVLPPDQTEIIGDPSVYEDKLRGRIGALEDMGLDPYHDRPGAAPEGPPPAAAPSGGRPAWAADADAHQAEMVRLLSSIEAQGRPVQPPAPGVLVAPPAVATR